MVNHKTSITVLETSDIHGHIFPGLYGSKETAAVGLGTIATYIKNVREQTGDVLVIDNGDLFQGTPLTYYYMKQARHLPNPFISVLNEIQYDAAVIGNHEFNYGLEPLHIAQKEAHFPLLCANILDKTTKKPFLGLPYIIKVMPNGVKVAVLGVTTHYIPNWENPSHIEGLEFKDALTSTDHWVSTIRKVEKPDVMIVSYHGGFEKDIQTGALTERQSGENQGYQICRDVKGIDVLLTGHQHRKLAGTIHGVSIVQPGMHGESIGKVSIELEQNHQGWTIMNKVPQVVSMTGIEADRDVLSIAHPIERETQSWLDEHIGTIKGNMLIEDSFQARLKEHPFIEFIQRVQMEAADASISTTALFSESQRGLSGKVTMRDIVSNYIYPNTLTVLEISGKDIRLALERSATYFTINPEGEMGVNPDFTIPKPQHYNYDMWEGIDYVLTISQPIGERVTSLLHNGFPVEEDKLYHVVMNHYRAGGGGEYTMFKNKPVIKQIQIDMTELIADYFLKHKTIHASCNHNWKVVKG
ncbi:bifunctional UDP-sugar hydrolase/5'-nucleotidase [Rossellomorea sp. AcN35-11]|nr:bifunctional metallophosphatase/5'-nucleotidase [Rossellomorea aquimaris]WJV31119.1 bifunctional UDP-sugar hydrolase/5'-nucleotidase [Rossellomorea sp. AcN35-11]